jgi:hypothetical protein
MMRSQPELFEHVSIVDDEEVPDENCTHWRFRERH